MKASIAFCALLFGSFAWADDLPVNVQMVAYDTAINPTTGQLKNAPCLNSYYVAVGYWYPFDMSYFNCGNALMDSAGFGEYGWAVVNLRPKTILKLTYSVPHAEIAVVRCVGCGKEYNAAGEVEIALSKSGPWVRASTWTRGDFTVNGPSRIAYKNGDKYPHLLEQALVPLPSTASVIYVRGYQVVQSPEVKWLPTILRVNGR